MGCGSSSNSAGTVVVNSVQEAPPAVKKEVVEPKPEVVKEEVKEEPKKVTYSQVHSTIRWNKPIEEVIKILETPGTSEFTDPKTGNYPIHIAAQNGHFDILKYLVEEKKVDTNVKNNMGNTALHMAVEYDYLDCARLLMANGADRTSTNGNGHQSGKGIEGKKEIECLALILAANRNEARAALIECKTRISEIPKTSLVAAGLKAKKNLGVEWTDDLQSQLKELLEAAN
jgi:ankyrin repeat protein